MLRERCSKLDQNISAYMTVLIVVITVQLTPKFFLPLMKTTSFLYYFSETIISIDKIPPILQAFKVVISCPTTEHGGIWVGPLLTSSKDIAQNTQETFDGVSSAVKTYLGYLCFMFSRNWTRLPNERSVSSSDTIWSLSTISTAPKYTAVSRKVVQQNRARQCRKVLWAMGFMVLDCGVRCFSNLEGNSTNKCIYAFSFLVV